MVEVNFAGLFCFRGRITLILLGVYALQVVKIIGSILWFLIKLAY